MTAIFTNSNPSNHSRDHQSPGQFQVICRIRPLQSAQSSLDIEVSQDSKTIYLKSIAKNITKGFTFHRIVSETVKQESFCRQISQEIFDNSYHSGLGSLILSYGVTNSGKTYTILGTEEEPGILPTIVSIIEHKFPQQTINITAVEIYNEEFFSLKNRQRLIPAQTWGTYLFNNYQPEKITKESTKEMIRTYFRNRNQTSTLSNHQSSRSHAIFKIQCGNFSMAIVDLAGSERTHKANSRIEETASINSSLFVLGKCIHALRDNNVIPFRESKLTKTIAEYFNENYKIYMIAHLNRSSEMLHQNVNVLEYASISTKVKQINPNVNSSILKSCKKHKSTAKSCVKFVQSLDDIIHDKKSILKKSVTPKHKSVVYQHQKSEMKSFEQKIKEKIEQDKRDVMDKYLNQIYGRIQQHEFYLDHFFEIQDEKDRKFIKQLQQMEMTYESPVRRSSAGIQKGKAQTRIRLRRQILQQIQKEKTKDQVQTGTFMGPSMKKCIQASMVKQVEKQERRKTESKMQMNESKLVKISEVEIEEKEQSITTPVKTKMSEEEKPSFIKKFFNNPAVLFKQGYNYVVNSNSNQIAHSVYKKIKHMISHNDKNIKSSRLTYVSNVIAIKIQKEQLQNAEKSPEKIHVSFTDAAVGSGKVHSQGEKRFSCDQSEIQSKKQFQFRSTDNQSEHSLLLDTFMTQNTQIQLKNNNIQPIREVRQSEQLKEQNSPHFFIQEKKNLPRYSELTKENHPVQIITNSDDKLPKSNPANPFSATSGYQENHMANSFNSNQSSEDNQGSRPFKSKYNRKPKISAASAFVTTDPSPLKTRSQKAALLKKKQLI